MKKPYVPLFETLDQLEARLSHTRFLFGDTPLETDWRLFVTLVRFDAVYHGHFKCNLRRIVDYNNLFNYLRDLYQQPGIAETVNFDHIKRHYYYTHDDINPTRIVPLGPIQDLAVPVRGCEVIRRSDWCRRAEAAGGAKNVGALRGGTVTEVPAHHRSGADLRRRSPLTFHLPSTRSLSICYSPRAVLGRSL